MCVLCFSLNGSVYFVCCVSDSVCEMGKFAICLGLVVILLLNVMELLSVVRGALLDRPCMCLRMMFLCVNLHMWSGKSLPLLCILRFVLVCHQYYVCKNYIGSVYDGGYGGLSESRLCVFRGLCPVGFIAVVEGPSVL